jgi:hypothetical protein
MPPQPDPTLAQKIEALKQKRPRITRADIGAILDVSVGSVRNYTSETWLAERGLSRFPDVDQELQEPSSDVDQGLQVLRSAVDQGLQKPRLAVESEAWGLCQSGDHEWMKDALYKGHAFRVTEEIREQPGNTGSTLVTRYKVTTCRFCGFSSEQRTFNCIVV